VLKIGFPRTLTYYSYFPFWSTFFQELGHEIVVSPVTSKEILDQGVRETVTDACVPVKLLHGHVLAIKDKVERIFVPRMISVEKEATFCPKFLGLPDMVQYSLEAIPELIQERIDLKKGPRELLKVCRRIGEGLGSRAKEATMAYHKALAVQKEYDGLLLQGILPPIALNRMEFEQLEHPLPEPQAHGHFKLAVLGYPYQVFDEYVSVNLVRNLLNMGLNVVTAEANSMKSLLRYAKKLPKMLFWHYSNQVLWSGYHYLDDPGIDGIIHVTAFGCGPDAMVDKLLELECKERGKPYMSISIDEQTAEAGIHTRLEAYVDMLQFREARA